MQAAIPNICHVRICRQTNSRLGKAEPRKQTCQMMTASSLPTCLCWLIVALFDLQWMQSSLQFPIPSFYHILYYWTKKAPVTTCVSSRCAFSCIFCETNVFNEDQRMNMMSGASVIHSSLDAFWDVEGVTKTIFLCTALRSVEICLGHLWSTGRNTWFLHSICRGAGTPFLHVSSGHRGREALIRKRKTSHWSKRKSMRKQSPRSTQWMQEN